MGERMKQITIIDIEEIANELREIINWVAVFEEEYDLPNEVALQLRTRLEQLALHLV